MAAEPIEIKFSHIYDKMPEEAQSFKTILFAVIPFEDKNTHKVFLAYDTLYRVDEKREHYELPKGKKLLLLLATQAYEDGRMFYAPQFILWTTLRRWTPEKESYYLSHLGEVVKIVVEGV